MFEDAELVLERYGALHTGVYVALCSRVSLSYIEAAKVCRISPADVRRIGKDLESMGLVSLEPSLVSLVEREPNPEAEDVLNYFVEKSGRTDSASEKWLRSQAVIAKGIVERFGAKPTKWMIDYILDVEEMDMYSLNLIYSMSGSLLKTYQKHLEAKNKLKEKKEEGNGWDDLQPSVLGDVKDKDVAPDDIDDLLSFGIEIEV